MSESDRVQRWRQRMREEGKEPLTLWLASAEKRRLEDLARQRHCTPADLVQQALAPWYASPGTVADTEQLHTVSDTVADTGSPIVTATVTDTLRKELPHLVRLVVEELRLQRALPATATGTDTLLSDVTATVTDTSTAQRADDRREAEPERVAATDTDTVVVPMTYPATVPVTDTVVVPMTYPVTDTATDTDNTSPAQRKAPARQNAVTENVSATVTGTEPALEPFDTTRFYLGKLCPKGHEFESTGLSLLRKHNQSCRDCENEGKRARRQARRQALAL